MKSENECCSRTKRGTETQIIVIKLFRKKKMDRKLASENALSSFYHFHQNFLVAYVSITI